MALPTVDLSKFNKTINVHISSPDEILFDGEAQAITTINDKGEFDILPLHENLICIIKKRVIVHYTIGKEKKEYPIEKGVFKVQKNKLYVLIGFEAIIEGTENVISDEMPKSNLPWPMNLFVKEEK